MTTAIIRVGDLRPGDRFVPPYAGNPDEMAEQRANGGYYTLLWLHPAKRSGYKVAEVVGSRRLIPLGHKLGDVRKVVEP